MARDFTELSVWQFADELRILVGEITARPGVRRDFSYCDQCNAAARSATANIAEGFGRFRHRDFARFLRIAVGSLHETRDHLIDGHRRGYLSDTELECGVRLSKRACGAAGALIRYLTTTPDPK
jgi:four helix bundle protein